MKFLVSMAIVVAAAVSVAAAAGGASEVVPTSAPATRLLKLPSIHVDIPARRVVLEAKVCLRSGALEFLICRIGTKEHESILHTPAVASDLHAAMLLLGLRQGIPAQWGTGDGADVAIPPKGPAVKIRLEWIGPDGKANTVDAGKWLHSAPGQEPHIPDSWVFVGSQLTDRGEYLADFQGEIVSVANFASSVFDVPLASPELNELLQFTANTPAIPPVGTDVRVIFEPSADAAKSPYARVYLEISRRGEMSADGQSIAPGELRQWARAFSDAHRRGQVVLRADGDATLWQIEQITRQLRTGGVRDFARQVIPPARPPLPMTEAQAERSLDRWRRKFGDSMQDGVNHPYSQIRRFMRQVDRELADFDKLRALWARYAEQLASLAMENQPTTRPVDKPEEQSQGVSGR